MSKTDTEIKKLFADTLLSDEQIYWLGAPLHNFWDNKGKPLLIAASLIFTILFISISIQSGLLWFLSEIELLLLILALPVFLALLVIGIEALERRFAVPSPKTVRSWELDYYAITSHRILIFDNGKIRYYWHFLMDMPILRKPKYGAASIQLYSSTYAAKKKKTPVLDTLSGLPENEADDAYAILKQAREEALGERKDKMGMA